LQFLRQQAAEHESFRLEQRLNLQQRRSFGRLRVPPQPCLDKFEVFQDQVRLALLGRENGVGLQERLLAHHFDLGVGLLVRFDQFMGLVQTRVFQIVFAQLEARHAE